jgi:hypothetical protein
VVLNTVLKSIALRSRVVHLLQTASALFELLRSLAKFFSLLVTCLYLQLGKLSRFFRQERHQRLVMGSLSAISEAPASRQVVDRGCSGRGASDIALRLRPHQFHGSTLLHNVSEKEPTT